MLNLMIASTYLHKGSTTLPSPVANMLNLIVASTFFIRDDDDDGDDDDDSSNDDDYMMMMTMMMMVMMTVMMMMMMMIMIMDHIYIYILKVHPHGMSKIRNLSAIPARSHVRVARILYPTKTWQTPWISP